jgi:hypothetical protein
MGYAYPPGVGHPPLGALPGLCFGQGALRLSIGQLDSQWYQGVWLVAYLWTEQVRKGWAGVGRWSGLGWACCYHGCPMGDRRLPEC